MKKDIYTTENDFTENFQLFDKVLHKQVVYTDNRTFQSFNLEWRNYVILDSREFVKAIKEDHEIMEMLSTVQPFTCYGMTSNKLAITFKKDLILPKLEALLVLNRIVNIGMKPRYQKYYNQK